MLILRSVTICIRITHTANLIYFKGEVKTGDREMTICDYLNGKVPKRVLSWLNPPPPTDPLVYPRQIPKAVVPSYIGDSGCVLNAIPYLGTGDTLHDWSGNGNHGKIYGAKWIDGEYGWSLQFDGSSAYVDCGSGASLDITNAITIEAWVYKSAAVSYGQILAKNVNGWQYLIQTDVNGNNAVAGFYDGSAWQVVTGTTVPLNTWQHIVYTFNGSAVIIHQNGVQTGSKTGITTSPASALTKPLIIGANPTDSTFNQFWDGLIYGVRIYSRALSAEEIKEHYESTRSLYGV
jgi:hypothetical protein